ncbi:T9SS type A sorting domain-containing protein [Parasegetibacter sp. NRK P23]|uniref:T9SS type A sorting domain-containing protein n=1 Tax=Parasegetibacter sp. NRK P23 TaxID=2942999 RepID=UPI00204340CF|nr:T9SS type A sorting domain-containing protein [Parasegetibacter sp. NRK P23]MCM5529400.1 T9SS type A sorting domain-containing protein [Parasegetibacter sp. NRK P23]
MPTGTLTYTDASLSAGAVRYYQVRATVSSGVTPFSNTAAASTVAYVINLNMNDGTANAPAQPGNWNNTNALIADGFVLPNMINDQGQATGINFGVTTAFSGFNYFGTTTGDNSGIYPDNVMKSFYYVNFADTARLRITGLTLAHEYNFAFFGSRVNPQVGVITAYKIGNQVVTLNAGNNTQNVAKISGVKPDADGSVSITIYGTVQGGFGYLNAMTIEGAPTILTETQPDVAISTGTITQSAITSAITLKTAQDEEQVRIVKATAFPNPFVDDITVEMKLTSDVSRFTVQVIDMNGKVVYSKDVANAQKGTWLQKLGLNGRLPKGMYFIRVNGLPGQGVQILKVVKR